MGDADETEVLEGFICPICKSDYGNPTKLLSHFQDEHSEEQDLIKTFKDLIDRAKKKILKQENVPEFNNGSKRTTVNSFEHVYEQQEIGLTSSHKDSFEHIREERLQRLAVPTNQILIRLEKLLDKMPTDPSKRKLHEQNVVLWVDETAVTRCPTCAGSFHFARRRHHCRTCGGIMCNDCSRFLSLTTARRILEKPLEVDGTQTDGEHNHLRLCVHCINLLELREERKESRNVKPIISQFYERLSEYKKRADASVIEYTKMADSLILGESTYNLQDAQSSKLKLFKLAENIDALSSKIAILGKDTENPPQGQALRLQTMVREATAAYLRKQLAELPNLPNEVDLQKIQDRRRQEITARIHEEKLKQHIHSIRTNHTSSHKLPPPSKQNTEAAVSKGQGWVPESKKVNEADDPLIEQMNIIRGYIKEARIAHKFDEVTSLEENLHELKKEYYKKQQEQEEKLSCSRSGDSSEVASLSSCEGGNRTQSESLHGDSSSH